MSTEREARRHAPVEGLARDAAGRLRVAGLDLETLASHAGGTPFHVLDAGLVEARIAAFRAAFGDAVQLHYAVKANPLPALLAWMAHRVDGADIASSGEMQRALQAGFAPAHLGYAGPGKTAAEITAATAAGVVITAESLVQVRVAAAAGARAVALRVNPEHALRASGMRMGGGPSAFGIDEERMPEALACLDETGLALAGLHYYAGSQNLHAERIAQGMRLHLESTLALLDGRPLPWLNLGGGFGVPYAAGEQPLDLSPIAQAVDEVARRLPGTRLRIELGRWLVADAGLYVSRVIEIKESRGGRFVVLDGGLHHNQPATGNFGQVIHRPHPVVNGSRHDDGAQVVADVVGPLCTPLDCFGRDLSLTSPAPGDLVAVLRSGAYGLTASPTGFLGHGACPELLIRDGCVERHGNRG